MLSSKNKLPIIVISQFLCTSLWFAGNAVMPDLSTTFNLEKNALGYLTSTVQLGFIMGTLIFAILSISDRYSPSKVFITCAILGAVFNIGLIFNINTLLSILCFRFLTGFFLAGIYPVGMKIASDYYEKGLGKSLGFLVGALVLGTAFPHLLKVLKGDLPWEFVLTTTSCLAILGGLLMLIFVPDGPYRKPNEKINHLAIPELFKNSSFKAAALGYFGHMWELYTFWTFVPFMLQVYMDIHPDVSFNISKLSFFVIGIGGLACVLGGYLAQKTGVKRVAFLALFLSGLCCFILPLLFYQESGFIFVSFLAFWGMVVIADSPLFSTLVAQNAPLQLKGTALTIVNSLGFTITIISIQLIDALRIFTNSPNIFVVLGIGPVLGLMALMGENKNKQKFT